MPHAKQMILDVLAKSNNPVAVHEMGIIGHSENALASRMCELERAGLVEGSYRQGKSFKEWRLRTGQLELIRKAGI